MKTNNLFLILFSIILISCQKEDVAVEIKPEVEEVSYEGTYSGMKQGTKIHHESRIGSSWTTIDTISERFSVQMVPYGISHSTCHGYDPNIYNIDSLKSGVFTKCSPTGGVEVDFFIQLKGIYNDTLILFDQFHRHMSDLTGLNANTIYDIEYILILE